MGWIEGLNDAMDYIEANLEGDLDLAHAARLAACTEGQFRRMFSYIAGIGLGEYVRRRRISRAALDLSRGERVVDVAVRYGYCSPTAFNRAFRDALGISPSEAKRPGAPLSVFPRLSFSLTVTGAEPLPWRIIPWGGMRLVGVSLPCGPSEAGLLAQMGEEGREELGRFWGGASRSGSIEALLALADGSGPEVGSRGQRVRGRGVELPDSGGVLGGGPRLGGRDLRPRRHVGRVRLHRAVRRRDRRALPQNLLRVAPVLGLRARRRRQPRGVPAWRLRVERVSQRDLDARGEEAQGVTRPSFCLTRGMPRGARAGGR